MKTRMYAALLCSLTATVAMAETVDVRFTGIGQGRSVKINLDGNRQNVFAGQLKHQLSNGTGDAATLQGEYVTFCNDLVQHVTSSTRTYDIMDIEDMPVAYGHAPMGAGAQQAIYDIYGYANRAQLGPNADRDLAAAFQIAVWEIAFDYDDAQGAASLDTDDGHLKVTSTSGGSLTSAILANLDNLFGAVGSGASQGGLIGIGHPDYQDQMVVVPLPAPVLLGSAGLLGIVAIKRRRLI